MADTEQAVEEKSEGLIDESLNQIEEERQQEADAHPEVVEDVLRPDTDPVEQQTVAKGGEETELSRPEYFPKKFWDEENGPDVEGLANAHHELEKQFSQGKHKAPKDGYDTGFVEGKGIAEDDPLLGKFQEWATEHGITQAAFETLANDYIEMELANLEQFEVNTRKEKEKLGPDADQVIRSTAEWVDGLHKKGILNDDELDAVKGTVATSAAGVRAMQKIRRYFGEGNIPIAQPPDDSLPTSEELYAMVGTDEYKKDPIYRKKVQDMFKKRHPDDPNTDYII